MRYEIWTEGNAFSKAYKLGEAEGETFEEACWNLMLTYIDAHLYFDNSTNTYAGCRLFENEQSARESFG